MTPAREYWLVFLFLTLVCSTLTAFIYDFGDPALMLGRSLDLGFEPGPSTHPFLYMLFHYPAKLAGDAGIAFTNMLFGVGTATLMSATVFRLGFLRYRSWLAYLLTLAMLSSHTLLIKTLSMDVYSLQTLINAGLFYALVRTERADRKPETSRWYFAFAIFLGLQVANHLWAVFLLPAAAWWGTSLKLRDRISLRDYLVGGLLSLIAAAPFTIPSFHMMLSEGFSVWYEASLGGDEVGGKFFGYSAAEMPKAFALGVAMLGFQFPILLLLLPNGAKRLFKEQRSMLVFFLLVFLPNAAASIFYKEHHAYEVMLTHYQVVFLVCGAGLPVALVGIRRRQSQLGLVIVATMALVVLPLTMRGVASYLDSNDTLKLQRARDFPLRSESEHFVFGLPRARGQEYAEMTIDALPEDAVILADWSYWTVLRRVAHERGRILVLSSAQNAERASFWKSPKLFDGEHYVVSNEAMFAKPAKTEGAKLEAFFGEEDAGGDAPLLYRVVKIEE